jgi:threonylcarbamoyladenosine tRNA methylthiotransferase MtaB
VNVYFHTFGCKANQYDTELVRQAFADQGAVLVDDPAAADLAVVNSCTVTAESETKLRRFVRGLARRGTKLETVVMGCAAALDEGRIAALPSVRAVVGGAEPGAVLAAVGLSSPAVGLSQPAVGLSSPAVGLSSPSETGSPEMVVSSPPDPLSTDVERGNSGPPFPLSVTRSEGAIDRSPSPEGRGGQGVRTTSAAQRARTRALLKIQDGCDEHCTFCATTIARGANRSRPIPELVAEAKALAEHHAEIVITGIHIGTYGQDRAADPGAPPRGQPTRGELLEALIAAVPQVRFRLSSIEATEVDDTIARLLIAAPQSLAAHLHAPLQSGSNRVLKRMGRHWYTAESYRARLEWLAARLPVFGLGADVIAGFPGEADADHRATLALVEALPFTYLHVFPFSVRPDAPAARLSEECSPATVRSRARELRELGEAKARTYRASRMGQRADGVVSGHGAGKIEMLTQDYLSVYLPTAEWDGCPRCEVTVR